MVTFAPTGTRTLDRFPPTGDLQPGPRPDQDDRTSNGLPPPAGMQLADLDPYRTSAHPPATTDDTTDPIVQPRYPTQPGQRARTRPPWPGHSLSGTCARDDADQLPCPGGKHPRFALVLVAPDAPPANP